MKAFPYSRLTLLVLSIALLASIPAFRIIDLHLSESYYDFFIYSPYSLYYIIAFCFIVASLIYFTYRKDLPHGEVNRCILYLFLSIAIFRLSWFIANYPQIMYTDVYLHGAPTLATIENGHILYPSDPAPASWPLSFYYLAQFALITGITDVRLLNLPLQVVVYLCPLFILYCSARRMSTNKLDLIISSIVTVSLYPGFILHYSRLFHALTLFSIYMYMIAWPLSPKRANYAILLLLLFSIVALDPIPALFPALMLGVLTLLFVLKSAKKGLLEISPSKQLILYLTLFLSWLIFVSTTYFGKGATHIYQAFVSGAVWTPIATTASTEIGLSFYGAVLKQSFKFFYVAIWLISLTVPLYRKDRPSLIYSSLALSMIPGAVVLASIDPEWTFMTKGWMILPLSIGLLLPSGFRYLSKVARASKVIANPSHKKMKFATGLSTLILLFLLLASSITVFEKNIYYSSIAHAWLDAGHKHVATYYRGGGPIAILDLNAIYYAYWHYAVAPEIQFPKMLNYRYVTPSDHFDALSPPIGRIITGVQSSDIAVISTMETYWLYSREHDNRSELTSLFSIVLSNKNLIYDNGYFITTASYQHGPP